MTTRTPYSASDPQSKQWSGVLAQITRWRPTEPMMVVGIIALYLLLGLWYSLAVPPFETPDEPFHYAFARHIAQGNGLPVQDAQATGPWAQEGSQAPLYYLITGWLTAGIDQSDFPELAVRNPRANIGNPLYPGNKNFMLYSGAAHPMTGANLALHIGRWVSLALGVITLLALYATARLATPPYFERIQNRLAVTSLLFTALIPQFVFISASFSNDSMMITAATVTVYWLARLLARPAEESIVWWEWVALGLLLGAAALSKLQGLGLFPLAALAGVGIFWQRRQWRPVLVALPLVALPALALAGWWYWRNVALYGDWSGLAHLLEINGQRTEPLRWGGFVQEFRGLRYSFWGLFGWFNLLLPGWFYTLMDSITVLSFVAVVLAFTLSMVQRLANPRRRADRRVRLMLLAWIVISLLALGYWILLATGSQGRLLLPALSAIAIMMVLGLTVWLSMLPSRAANTIWLLLVAIMLGMSLFSLTRLIPQAYRQPLPVDTLPAGVRSTDMVYGDAESLHLKGLAVSGGRFHPGEDLPVTLYLTSDTALTRDYQIFVQLLDDRGEQLANVTSHPGWGRNPTTLWQPGALYPDPYLLHIDGPVDNWSPLLAHLYIGFVDPDREDAGRPPLPARTQDGVEVTPFLADVVIEPADPPTAEALGLAPVSAEFGGVIALTAQQAPPEVAAGATLTVTLLWEAVGQPAADYAAFVHLRDEAGNRLVGYDRAPAGDRYPTTYWRAGNRIVSVYPLALPATLPAGRYQLWTGLYTVESGGAARLPVTAVDGMNSGDGEVGIGMVVVTAPR